MVGVNASGDIGGNEKLKAAYEMGAAMNESKMKA